jgi:adenylate cyclase
MAETRKLAAILAADVAGYSRLAGSDEDRTLARLRGLWSDLIDPAIAAHHGRVVKRTGDGVLIEFRSVVDAVRCGIEVQNGMVERNAGLPPERRIEFRIGIHLGDVVEESDGDLMGDGINIAARLEGIAKPGAIFLSEDAYRQVKSRLDLAVSDLGAIQLKNIAEPVRVYSLAVGRPAQAKPTKPAVPKQRSIFLLLGVGIVALLVIAGGIWLAVRPARGPEMSATTPRLSVVVLPFANLSGDPAQDYLADVLTEELTTGLSRISGTFVIARSTAFTYKGKPVDVKQVGKDLGVRYVLEGGEQQSGDRVRVNAQLIEAETGAHLWADQFDADRANLLRMQDEIVTRLARALEIQLSAVDAARVEKTRPGNLDAEDLARRCKAAFYSAPTLSKEWEGAFALCRQALQMDDRNVNALGLMAFWYILPVIEAQSADPQAAIRQADELASRAIAIDPNDYWAYWPKAWVLMAQNRHEEAIVAAERGLALNPSFIEAYEVLCGANNFLAQLSQLA